MDFTLPYQGLAAAVSSANQRREERRKKKRRGRERERLSHRESQGAEDTSFQVHVHSSPSASFIIREANSHLQNSFATQQQDLRKPTLPRRLEALHGAAESNARPSPISVQSPFSADSQTTAPTTTNPLVRAQSPTEAQLRPMHASQDGELAEQLSMSLSINDPDDNAPLAAAIASNRSVRRSPRPLRFWSVDDVARWISTHESIAEFSVAFRLNEIDGAALIQVVEQETMHEGDLAEPLLRPNHIKPICDKVGIAFLPQQRVLAKELGKLMECEGKRKQLEGEGSARKRKKRPDRKLQGSVKHDMVEAPPGRIPPRLAHLQQREEAAQRHDQFQHQAQPPQFVAQPPSTMGAVRRPSLTVSSVANANRRRRSSNTFGRIDELPSLVDTQPAESLQAPAQIVIKARRHSGFDRQWDMPRSPAAAYAEARQEAYPSEGQTPAAGQQQRRRLSLDPNSPRYQPSIPKPLWLRQDGAEGGVEDRVFLLPSEVNSKKKSEDVWTGTMISPRDALAAPLSNHAAARDDTDLQQAPATIGIKSIQRRRRSLPKQGGLPPTVERPPMLQDALEMDDDDDDDDGPGMLTIQPPSFMNAGSPGKPSLPGLQLDLNAINSEDDTYEASVEFTDVGAMKFAGFTISPNGISVAPKKRRSSLKRARRNMRVSSSEMRFHRRNGNSTRLTNLPKPRERTSWGQLQPSLVPLEYLGKGASGSVQLALYVPELMLVAVKSVHMHDADRRHQFSQEIKALHQVGNGLLPKYVHKTPRSRPISATRRGSDSSQGSMLDPGGSQPTQRIPRADFRSVSEQSDIGTIGEHTVLEETADHSSMLSVNALDDSTLDTSAGQSAVFDGWCPYIVAFYDAFTNPADGDVCMVLEYMNAGSLEEFVRNMGPNRPSEAMVSMIAEGVLRGLKAIHSKKQLHRDVKLGNILLDCQNNVKLSDFGLAKEVNTMSMANSFKGTCVFMSPERIEGKDYSYVSDIWSLGICLIMLVTGKSPVPTNTYWAAAQAITGPDDFTVEEGSDELKDFIAKCLKKDPAERSNTADLLQHPFIKNYSQFQPASAPREPPSPPGIERVHVIACKAAAFYLSHLPEGTVLPQRDPAKILRLADQLNVPDELVLDVFSQVWAQPVEQIRMAMEAGHDIFGLWGGAKLRGDTLIFQSSEEASACGDDPSPMSPPTAQATVPTS